MDLTDYKQYCHAVGLHRDPQRARTHIIIQQIIYTPKASQETREKFRIIACSVFRRADAYGLIERVMMLKPGEGREYVEVMRFQESGVSIHDLAGYVVVLTCGQGIPAWVGGDPVSNHYLETHPYNPEWRRLLNPGMPPMPIPLDLERGAAKDAEHDY